MLGVTLLALAVTCGGYLLLQEIRAAPSDIDRLVVIEIEPGATTTQIATTLRAAGLIRQPLLFTLLVRMSGLEGRLQAGKYTLSPTMTMHDILAALQHSRVEEVRLTIPEGLRLEEIADRVGETGVVSAKAFLDAARNGAAFQNRSFFLKSLPPGASLEGYLFPDTYRIAETATVTEIIEILLGRFDQQYRAIETEVRIADASVHQIITMASIVQREARLESEMARISAVFWNRLKPENLAETGGGKLQADPTIQYALGYSDDERTWWRKKLTLTDLQIDSPYNTRRYAGLPPGPICSPGLKAIQAAAQPDEGANYLYFVASCNQDGSHNFATNYLDFQLFEAEYRSCSE